MVDLLDTNEAAEMSRGFRTGLAKLGSAIHFTPLAQLEGGVAKPAKKAAIDKLAAMADELERLGGCTGGQAAALRKHAAVSEDAARQSLDRLQSLEQNKPTIRQAGRYGGIGAAGGAAAGIIGNTIEHGGALKGGTPKARVLNLAANAAKGALAGGAIPLARNQLDRRAEVGTLKSYLSQQGGTNA